MTKFSDLPEHIVVEILLWLPPESLFRFKCVERLWYFLINDVIRNPKFVTKHLNNSKKKASPFIIKCVHEFMSGASLHIYHNENNRQHLISSLKDLAPLLPKSDDVLGVFSTDGISHCNGIICMADYFGSRIVLCNPATRELKRLPNPSFRNWILNCMTKVGFGYDYIDNVYKVVRFCGRHGTFKAQVYTLGLDDAWRDIEVNQLVESFNEYNLHTKEVHCKGFYYWLVCKMPKPNQRMMQMIQSFDMHKEKFDTIPLPDIVQSRRILISCGISLTQWNESLALIFIMRKEWYEGKSIDIWVMHESFEGHRNSRSWTKQISLDLGGIHKITKVFLGSEELLVHAIEQGIFSYNMHTKKVTWILKGITRRFHAFYYVRSLVSLNGICLDFNKDVVGFSR
ncbi:hypothetical protein TIFTF001_012614 [Ficus carica]|uniref:F-box domain-containing protein n=1 Tax=Ficus carica TaxID=3494 RepID=A0AA88D3V7_FICCA|nr:hypothetical protein TIFTF001_012614 [Ficus carica]